jgi:hypothetical protein
MRWPENPRGKQRKKKDKDEKPQTKPVKKTEKEAENFKGKFIFVKPYWNAKIIRFLCVFVLD